MSFCVACGQQVAARGRFCSGCGTPVPSSDADATVDFASATSPLPPKPPSSKAPSGSPKSSGRSSSRSQVSGAFRGNDGLFLPGQLLANRYRIVALLGKGGMGEVYRADDLTLGQPVALKFLPDAAAQSEELLERFRNEVRMARRVSHPNVCRVYDVGEVDGQTFFTMEYVDGEDLAALLRRIGRLPSDKALDIARQLCAGLSAAHSKGVLHRDLKPANIMLDGRGQVVITDFGLAGVADEIRGSEVSSGTPAYMSPEQLKGTEVTARSDIYALGLVLYEVFTGKRAFDKPDSRARGGAESAPSRPSSLVKDLDPVVERVILRCLETDPGARPANVLSVAAALPGGDPLAAALAAGETPSPQMVAAAGENVGLRPGVALSCLAAVLVGLAIGVYFCIHYSGLEKMHPDQPPEVLAQRAREITTRLGYQEKAADSASGFTFDTDFTDYVEKHANHPDWNQILAGRPPVLEYWRRQSPKNMSASGYSDLLLTPGVVQQTDPPTTLSGMINLRLDASGRLIFFQAIPPEKDASPSTSVSPDWSALFLAAEIDPAKLQSATPQWNSLAAADARAAWTGTWPGTSWALRVEAAAWHGKPVYFALLGDWTKPERMVPPHSAEQAKRELNQTVGFLLLLILLITAALTARRNFRSGRADREGGFRLATVMFFLELSLWLCSTHLVAGWDTLANFMLCIASALLIGGVTWILYLALEPWIRRRWPQALIAWSRLLSGRLRDPLVGRDILFGVAFGVLWLLIFVVALAASARSGGVPQFSSTGYLMGGRTALAQWLIQIPTSIISTLQFFFVLLGLKLVLRKDWIAAVAFVALFVALRTLQSTQLMVEVPVFVVIFSVLVVIVFRFGLVPLAVGAFTVDMLANVPFTADFSAWYVSSTILTLLSVVALAGWGFYHSLGGRTIWRENES
jgi:Protein kinase domain